MPTPTILNNSSATMPASDQGLNSKRYTCVPRTLTFITRQNHVLLIKGGSDKKLWANLYNGIGGHVERGENIRLSAIREVNEETGLVVQNLQYCGMISVDVSEETGVCIFVFKGESFEGEPLMSQEGILEWVHYDEMYKLPLVEDLYILLPRVLVFTTGMEPFFGHFSYDHDGQLVITFEG